MGLIVPRVRPTLTRFPINILYTQVNNTLAFLTKCVTSVGKLLMFLTHATWSSPKFHSRIAFDYFSLNALLLYPSHAIVKRLHGHDASNVVILIPKTADLLGL